jgi:hypothetical protein
MLAIMFPFRPALILKGSLIANIGLDPEGKYGS